MTSLFCGGGVEALATAVALSAASSTSAGIIGKIFFVHVTAALFLCLASLYCYIIQHCIVIFLQSSTFPFISLMQFVLCRFIGTTR